MQTASGKPHPRKLVLPFTCQLQHGGCCPSDRCSGVASAIGTAGSCASRCVQRRGTSLQAACGHAADVMWHDSPGIGQAPCSDRTAAHVHTYKPASPAQARMLGAAMTSSQKMIHTSRHPARALARQQMARMPARPQTLPERLACAAAAQPQQRQGARPCTSRTASTERSAS